MGMCVILNTILRIIFTQRLNVQNPKKSLKIVNFPLIPMPIEPKLTVTEVQLIYRVVQEMKPKKQEVKLKNPSGSLTTKKISTQLTI